jgi:hypothetical protein
MENQATTGREIGPIENHNSSPKIKKDSANAKSILLFGGPSGARTPNLLIKSQLLYQLS